MSLTIQSLHAWEILDSRGRPTLAVEAALSDGTAAQAQVPSGASTGTHEAVELRDGDPQRYAGKGVLRAASHVNTEIAALLQGKNAEDQAAVDRAMIELDGTPQKSRLGANALLGVSCAVARAVSVSRREPLFQTLSLGAPRLPVPMINILSGGLHAGANIEFQDFLIIPHGFDSYAEALEATVRIHAAAGQLILAAGHTLTGVADEGGWGPRLASNQAALALLTEAIGQSGYQPGAQVSIAIDVASSHFYANGIYTLRSEGRTLDSAGMAALLGEWTRRFPVVSIEDGLFEDDWSGWRELTRQLTAGTQLLGDDFFTTNPGRLRRGIQEGCANAVLVKMNQIGTLTETFEVCRLAKENGYAAVVSARSGETEDSFLADLAAATGAGQIKIGSITRSERLAKYNRLLELEARHGLAWQGRAFSSSIQGRGATLSD
ncbi:MAG TPA: phosphopyruvate hydratase [Bryobacteraceae bacterium]|nr:phosphopyruvate hydratase [Bryobacteraceae bacterium]